MKEESKWDGQDRRKVRTAIHKVERFLVRFRILSIAVMVWSGYLMGETVLGITVKGSTAGEAGMIAAILTPLAAIFKFAFDFALDGKIDNNI